MPHGHWKIITFVAGLRRHAIPMNATNFVTYLKEYLVSKLKRGDVVMMGIAQDGRAAGRRTTQILSTHFEWGPRAFADQGGLFSYIVPETRIPANSFI